MKCLQIVSLDQHCLQGDVNNLTCLCGYSGVRPPLVSWTFLTVVSGAHFSEMLIFFQLNYSESLMFDILVYVIKKQVI